MVVAILVAAPTLAEEASDSDGLVEIHFRRDPQADFTERRTRLSYRIGAVYENFSPTSYVNPVNGSSYASLYSTESLPIYSGFFGAQWNTGVGSISADAVYGLGTMEGQSGSSNTLGISKFGAAFGYAFDAFGRNPWVIPVLGLQVLELGFTESEPSHINTGTTAITVAYSFGISIPLNRFDSSTAVDGFMDFGVKNAYLDVFAIAYNTSSSSNDPDLATGLNWAAGFHVEF